MWGKNDGFVRNTARLFSQQEFCCAAFPNTLTPRIILVNLNYNKQSERRTHRKASQTTHLKCWCKHEVNIPFIWFYTVQYSQRRVLQSSKWLIAAATAYMRHSRLNSPKWGTTPKLSFNSRISDMKTNELKIRTKHNFITCIERAQLHETAHLFETEEGNCEQVEPIWEILNQ